MPGKTVIISSGDPAGIGPWVSIKALAEVRLPYNTRCVLIGDEYILSKISGYRLVKKKVRIINLNNARHIKPGVINKQSGRASLEYLYKAVEMMKDNPSAALVTGPVSKEAVSLNERFLGHTEFLARAFSASEVLMMMVGKKLRVALLTRHLLLRKVSFFLRRHDFSQSISLMISALKGWFGISRPRVGVCSFNPHAGVDTFLKEEEEAILAILKKFKNQRVNFIGPYPADSVFRKAREEKWDCVLSLYHDQAMIPFRLLEFEKGVNLTVGLPIVRTSPAHGVAAELVRTPYLIKPGSMKEAISLASRLLSLQNL